MSKSNLQIPAASKAPLPNKVHGPKCIIKSQFKIPRAGNSTTLAGKLDDDTSHSDPLEREPPRRTSSLGTRAIQGQKKFEVLGRPPILPPVKDNTPMNIGKEPAADHDLYRARSDETLPNSLHDSESLLLQSEDGVIEADELKPRKNKMGKLKSFMQKAVGIKKEKKFEGRGYNRLRG